MSANLFANSRIDAALRRFADRVLPRLFIGVSVVVIHGFGLMYVQAVEADQVLDSAMSAAQPQHCERARGGKLA